MGEGPVEVEGVGDVELGLEPHRAGEVHVVVVDRGVARVDEQVAVLRIRGRVDVGEVVALDRLGDEPVQLRGTDPTGDRGDLRVDERRCLDRQGRGRVDGGLRDRPGPPRRDPSGVDLRPQPREAVAQLEGVTDELLRRGRRDAQDGAELGEAELRDQRRTLARDGLLVLTTRDGERSRVVDRLRRVQVGPPGRQDQLVSCRPRPRSRAAARIEASRSRGGEVVDLTCSGPCQRLDHVFDSTGDHRQRPWLWTVPGHLSRTGFVTGLRPSSTTKGQRVFVTGTSSLLDHRGSGSRGGTSPLLSRPGARRSGRAPRRWAVRRRRSGGRRGGWRCGPGRASPRTRRRRG